jgi:hypothetical protein
MNTKKASSIILPIREIGYAQPTRSSWTLTPIFSHSRWFGDLHEKDIVDIVRISPRDAQKGFSLAEPSDKVTGTMVYHFGAFFKRSWRSNDILWGRLDGLCQLVETLLEEKRNDA